MMPRITVATLIAAVAIATMVNAREPVPPALRLPDTVTPTAYGVELRVDPRTEGFTGRVRIDATVAEETTVVWLHARDLELDELRVSTGGEPVEVARTVTGGDDFLGLVFASPLAAGPVRIDASFAGTYQLTDTHSLFKQEERGDWYVFSQLEATYARRVFPCFDEPRFKTPWELTLHVPRGFVAVTNTEIREEIAGEDGGREIRFARTKPLPTYLVALAVGPFDVVDLGRIGKGKVPFRILTARGLGDRTGYAAETTGVLLGLLEDYVGAPYPFEKLDLVGIPQTVGFGAMENPGLVTYSQSILLPERDAASLGQRRRLATVTAHELAHMWFGNLVTLDYWDDIWLNESFASWMETKLVDAWKPEWELDVSAVRGLGWAMGSDSLVSARRIRQPIEKAADIENAFDFITYSKGEAVLAWFDRWLGEERFRAGVRRYLAAHAYGTATGDDFLAALGAEGGEQGDAVEKAFRSFLDQPGFPLVSVSLACEKGKPVEVRLAQERFLPEGSQGSKAQLWTLPVCFRYPVAGSEKRACVVLDQKQATVPLAAEAGCPRWLVANDGHTGYYRVHYGDGLLDPLLADQGVLLGARELVGTLGDLAALVQTGKVSIAAALAVAPAFAGHPDRTVVSSVAGIVGRLKEDDLVPEELMASYTRFLRQTFGERARALGFQPKLGEDEDTRLLRGTLVGLMADAGEDDELRAEARRLALAWLDDRTTVDADMVDTVLEVAAIDGDAKLFDRFLAEARKTEERRDRMRLLATLGHFREAGLNRRALGLILDKTLDIRETGRILRAALSDASTRESAWSFFKKDFDAYVERIPSEAGPWLPSYATAFCDEAHRQDAETFLTERVKRFPGAERTLAQALERVSLCIASRKSQLGSVEAFLKAY